MRFEFDQIVVDADLREIRREGEIAKIEPKAFDLLLFLIKNKDRVVSKEELIEAIWSGRFISDAAISSCVSAARKALQDDGREQKYLKTQHGRGFRFIGSLSNIMEDTPHHPLDRRPSHQIQFCKSEDGTQIAYAISGEGPPMVKAGNWMTHLEFDWHSPVWSHLFAELNQGRQLIRYDSRGNGLSSWDVTDLTLERQIEDLEAVVAATGLRKFPLICVSQGAPKGIAYAVRYPEKVEKMVILGGYSRGWRVREKSGGLVMSDALVHMLKIGWGAENPAVRNLFTNIYMPDAPIESQRWFSDLQRKSATAENAVLNLDTFGNFNVGHLLADVKVPTLVIHARSDAGVPFSEGQDIAAGIPGAQFVTLNTSNHILPETDPAWQDCKRAIREYLGTVLE